MIVDLSDFKAHEAYFLLTQTVLPRPIAWVLTENADGLQNLAPFSFFNAICSAPPLIGFSVGKRPDGNTKDTYQNIIDAGKFVVHIAHSEQLDALNASAESIPSDVSEVEKLGLDTSEFEGFALPRLSECRIAMACELHQDITLGQTDQQAFLIGEVKQMYLDESVAEINEKGRLKVDANKLQPLGRLGASEYTYFGEVKPLKPAG